MADENEEDLIAEGEEEMVAEDGEEVLEEETPLSAEELFEQHKAEIDAAFEEKGFFRRLRDMLSGLSKPHSSAEYKLARTELQRLAAPILAILLPILGVIVLIVVTEVTARQGETVQVEIAQAQEEQEELKEEEPEQEVEPETPPDENVEVTVDTPSVNNISEMANNAPPTTEPVSVKPAEADTVAIIKSPVTMRSMAGSRSPGVRGKYTSGGAGYGDANTEAAVMKALRWLKKTQLTDGSWNRQIHDTSLAILTFLAHGETPSSKEFGNTVERAMQNLVDSQFTGKDKVVRFNGAGGTEYGFLMATYALGETYGMTKNPNTKEAAIKAMKRIIDNQSPTGGWDYNMKKTSTRDDLSYAGWAMQALKACKMAGLHPKGLDECIKKAIKCVKTRNFSGGGFNYQAGGGPTGLTATGCLCMQLLGYANDKEVATALESMREWKPAFAAKGNFRPGGPLPGTAAQYYCYYASQCKYQAGMKEGANAADVKTWQTWNAAMKALYPSTIKTLPEKIEGPDGKMHSMGYWPKCNDIGSPDDTMATCLCALQLMVYYRYLPTTQTKAGAVEDNSSKKGRGKKSKKEDVDIEVDI